MIFSITLLKFCTKHNYQEMSADIDKLIIDGYIRPMEKQLKYFNIIPYTINQIIYQCRIITGGIRRRGRLEPVQGGRRVHHAPGHLLRG